jgi:hypothetical protein
VIPGEDIRRQIGTGDMAQMKRTIGIRPGNTDKNSLSQFYDSPSRLYVILSEAKNLYVRFFSHPSGKDFFRMALTCPRINTYREKGKYLFPLFLNISGVAFGYRALHAEIRLLSFFLFHDQIPLPCLYKTLTIITSDFTYGNTSSIHCQPPLVAFNHA